MTLVFNASPIIVLAKAGLLDPILELASQVIIPRSVADEISRFNDTSKQANSRVNSRFHFPLLCFRSCWHCLRLGGSRICF